ncbi:MAG TPA: histidine kinase [Longimicrobium sp.]|uniref:sensor histidine kinase n=1 Tax=Longimicrobium sp. TaxID=2029185 RepID=UPI002ED98482
MTETRTTPAQNLGDAPEETARLGRGELLAIALFWLFMALLTAANRLLEPRRPGLAPGLPTGPIAMAVAEMVIWMLVTPLVFGISRRFVSGHQNRAARIALLFVGGIGVSIFVDLALDFVRVYVLHLQFRGRQGFDPWRSLSRLWFIREMVVYCGIVAAGLARDYFWRYRARQEEAVRLQAETARLQAQLAEARLATLRTQIDPHFLFNTLNAVSALVERDPPGVRRMIARLSELLRHSLEGAGDAEVPLRQELAFVDKYLEIMRIRFQGSLEVETVVDDEVRDALVPNLVLQPLVENAVKHGVSRLRGAGKIEIRAHLHDGRVVLRVRDNGPGLADAPQDGVGLRNTRERLAQLYGEAQSFALRPAEGGGTEAEVSLPFHTRGDLRALGVTATAGVAG